VCVCLHFSGICGSKDGVESIVIRGKHPEDKDTFFWFVYTGVGGTYRRKRDRDQTFTGV
jgi:hypothetical protein